MTDATASAEAALPISAPAGYEIDVALPMSPEPSKGYGGIFVDHVASLKPPGLRATCSSNVLPTDVHVSATFDVDPASERKAAVYIIVGSDWSSHAREAADAWYRSAPHEASPAELEAHARLHLIKEPAAGMKDMPLLHARITKRLRELQQACDESIGPARKRAATDLMKQARAELVQASRRYLDVVALEKRCGVFGDHSELFDGTATLAQQLIDS